MANVIPDAQVDGVVFLKILETRLSEEQVNGVVFLKILETRLTGEQVVGVVFLKILETSPHWRTSRWCSISENTRNSPQ